MRKFLLSASFILIYTFVAFAQDEPAPSPASTVMQKVGLTDVTIEYSRPGLKGRDMFEALTPVDKMWRTGANTGTKITFSTDVKVEGKDVPAGKYTFYSIPGASEWTIMIYKDNDLGGYVSRYDEANELTRFKVKSMAVTPKVETMTFGVNDISKDGTKASIVFMWENTAWKLNVEVPKTW
jgi:hypothetical protein